MNFKGKKTIYNAKTFYYDYIRSTSVKVYEQQYKHCLFLENTNTSEIRTKFL